MRDGEAARERVVNWPLGLAELERLGQGGRVRGMAVDGGARLILSLAPEALAAVMRDGQMQRRGTLGVEDLAQLSLGGEVVLGHMAIKLTPAGRDALEAGLERLGQDTTAGCTQTCDAAADPNPSVARDVVDELEESADRALQHAASARQKGRSILEQAAHEAVDLTRQADAAEHEAFRLHTDAGQIRAKREAAVRHDAERAAQCAAVARSASNVRRETDDWAADSGELPRRPLASCAVELVPVMLEGLLGGSRLIGHVPAGGMWPRDFVPLSPVRVGDGIADLGQPGGF